MTTSTSASGISQPSTTPFNRWRSSPTAHRTDKGSPKVLSSTVREHTGPHLLAKFKGLLDVQDLDVGSPVCPTIAFLSRSKEMDLTAEGVPDGIDRGQVVVRRIDEDDGNHGVGRSDSIDPLGANGDL